METAARASRVLHRSIPETLPGVARAHDNHIYLTNGSKIFDASGGAGVSCIGHGNEKVVDAIREQARIIDYLHTFFFTCDPVEQLADFLIDSTNGDMNRAFFCSSGSEANEAALKLARQFHLEKTPSEPQRCNFIARKQSYHGTTLGALGVGSHRSRRAAFEPILATNTSWVSPCFPYRPPRAGLNTDAEHVAFLEQELDAEFRKIGPRTVAAFFVEPVVGAALGCVAALPGYFAAVRRVCDRYGALLIMDDVMGGCGRVGPEPSAKYPDPLHAYQDPVIGGVVPDVLTLGKGLGGGYQPIAAMLINEKIANVLEGASGMFSHGQTYQAHPVACRAALEVQRIIKEQQLVDNVRKLGRTLGRRLKEELLAHPNVGDIRGRGFFWAIEFVVNKQTKMPFDKTLSVASKIHKLGLEPPYSLSLYPGTGCYNGDAGDHIMICPAYNCTSAEIESVVTMTAALIKAFFGSSRSVMEGEIPAAILRPAARL